MKQANPIFSKWLIHGFPDYCIRDIIKSIILILFLCSCNTQKETVKDLVKMSNETGRLRQEIAVKTIYPDLNWSKIDSVYQKSLLKK